MPLQGACLSSKPEKKENWGKKKEGKQRRGIWRIRGPDWVSNKYSEKKSVLTSSPFCPGYALKESDNFALSIGGE